MVIRRSHDRIINIVGIPILGKAVFYTETEPNRPVPSHNNDNNTDNNNNNNNNNNNDNNNNNNNNN